MVEYHRITAKDQSRIHHFGKKVLLGLFLGYALYAGGIWKGDMLVADIEELEMMYSSEIYSKRLNAKEVIFPEENGNFIFPVEDGRIKPLGGNQDLRTSTSIRDRPIRGESHLDFLREPKGSLPPPHDSFPDAGAAINDFWSMSGNFIYRHHVEPRQISLNFLIGRKTSRRIYVVREETNEKTADIQTGSSMARTLGQNRRMPR